jgi:H+/gluconate symporter-like permease
MSGMPFFQALILLASVTVIIVATQWRQLHPFLAIMVIASAFGLAAGFSVGFLGKAFGAGFSQTIYSPGLVIVAAGFVAGVAESTAAPEWLTAKIDRWRWLGSTRLGALLGLVAGIGASRASAFALLTPLLRAVSGAAAPKREATTVASALAISASHGLLLVSPVPIAAASILDAGWGRLALFGLPLALLLVACGAAWGRVDGSIARRHSQRAARWGTGSGVGAWSWSPAGPLFGRTRHYGHRSLAAEREASYRFHLDPEHPG